MIWQQQKKSGEKFDANVAFAKVLSDDVEY